MRTPFYAALGLLASSLLLLGCQSSGAPGDASSGSAAASGSSASSTALAADARQIHWQRSLEDALAIAKAEGRPLLLAVNMDGESASDRIVREEYRDPAFVAASRRYVCLVASLFRHNPRDYDDEGRRIPCPRLGSCTCGEHIALEPILFERFLSDGERVAPRHAAILPGGTKAWDLSLSFDLKDIDRAVLETAESAPRARVSRLATRWDELAASRSVGGRRQLEAALERALDEASLRAALLAIGAHGDAASLDALRQCLHRLPGCSPDVSKSFVACVRKLALEGPIANALRAELQTIDAASTGVPERAARSLQLLAELDGPAAATRAFLLACRAMGYPGAERAVELAFPAETASAIASAVESRGGVFELSSFLEEARAQRRAAAGVAPKASPISGAMRSEELLLADLADLDRQRRARPDDIALRARAAKASLDLARRRIESGGSGVAALLIDAEQGFADALEAEPAQTEWWIERARAAYYRSAFDEQVAHARAALREGTGKAVRELGMDAEALDGRAVEALRWIGDGNARRFAAQLGEDPARAIASMLEGLRSLGLVAVSAYGSDGDWAGLASFCGALGLRCEEFAVARAGVLRLPGGRALRQSLRQALRAGGRAELGAPLADQLAEQLGRDHPGRADAEWFAGYAWMQQAEDERRAELPDAALASYAAARRRFDAVAAMRPDYAASSTYYAALCWLGAGLAHARAGRREAAAAALVSALVSVVSRHAGLAAARDGLGYDALDLVDKIFEWRASGPSPVDPMRLWERVAPHVAEDAFFAVAIADSQLREALRADGRNPVRAERETVDAAGAPIRMRMGLPNAEGDAYLRASIRLLRLVAARLTSEEDKKSLAQADTIWAERMLERGRLDGVREALDEAATLLGQELPNSSDRTELARVAATLRAVLGEARPRWRVGR